MEVQIDTIRQFVPLYDPSNSYYKSRYQVYYGGRAGRKSWEIARALLTRAMTGRLRILCAREFQNSIADSVHKLLSDQIEMLGYSAYFNIQKTIITSNTGSSFIFKGLAAQNINSIKSMEGIDVVWIEEAQAVSEHSWSILIPTIRKKGSQIIVSFNPDLESDPTYQRFILGELPDCYVTKVNYTDNPDCPEEAKHEAEYLKRVDYESYAHIWLGELRKHSEAQIFRNWVVDRFEVDATFGYPLLGADWGFSVDPTTLVKSYIKDRILYVRSEAYKVGAEIDDTPKLFDTVTDSRLYTIRADNARPELISNIRSKGFKIQAADKWPGCVEDRIGFIKNFEKVIIHPDCSHTAEEFRLYSYKVHKLTGDVLPDVLPLNDHCIDAIGYALTPLIKPGPTRGAKFNF